MSNIQLVPMTYNFHIALIDSSHVVVDPNNLLASTDSVPSIVDVVVAAGGALLGGFQECTGLDTSLEVEDYKEGGVNDRIRKFPSRLTWSNIVLKRGIGFGDDLWNWHAAYVTGTGKRRDGLIVLENDLHVPLKMWQFARGLPIKWTGPTFSAKASEVAIEALEIVHEGITLTSPASIAGGAANAVAGAAGVSL
jgi:phage tail-like protein